MSGIRVSIHIFKVKLNENCEPQTHTPTTSNERNIPQNGGWFSCCIRFELRRKAVITQHTFHLEIVFIFTCNKQRHKCHTFQLTCIQKVENVIRNWSNNEYEWQKVKNHFIVWRNRVLNSQQTYIVIINRIALYTRIHLQAPIYLCDDTFGFNKLNCLSFNDNWVFDLSALVVWFNSPLEYWLNIVRLIFHLKNKNVNFWIEFKADEKMFINMKQ